MPANNNKIIPRDLLCKLNQMYSFTYDREMNEIIVKTTSSIRETRHSAATIFRINARKFGRVVHFNPEIIELWIKINDEIPAKKYSLFDVYNAFFKLRRIYQKANFTNIKKMLQDDFFGVKTIDF